MSRINAFSSRVASSASASASAPFTAEQPNQRTHISTFTRYQHNVSAMLQVPGESNIDLKSEPVKPKRVTAPLNEAVRTMLCGNWAERMPTATTTPVYSTSGSDHRMDSAILTDMRFLEEEGCGDCSRLEFSEQCGSDAESSSVQPFDPLLGEQLCHILEDVSNSRSKLEIMLVKDVSKAVEIATEKADLGTQNQGHKKGNLRRFVMNSLRSAGYNAAVCKTRWEQTNGYPAGDYELIDVIVEASSCKDRVVVDIEFRAQFEIARPTPQYAALVEVLPLLFVGREDKLRDIIQIMSYAAKRSLKAKGMHLPPWRKYRYALAKWLGPYNRTTYPVLSTPTEKLLLSEFDGSAALKGADATHELKLLFEKSVREGSHGLQCCAGVAVSCKIDKRKPLRISGLATALTEAACR